MVFQNLPVGRGLCAPCQIQPGRDESLGRSGQRQFYYPLRHQKRRPGQKGGDEPQVQRHRLEPDGGKETQLNKKLGTQCLVNIEQ